MIRRTGLLLVLGMSACATEPSSVRDYREFYERAPYTVVVLPVANETTEVQAPRYFLSTITHPLVERGYYVLPVEATADILAAEGLGEGGALRAVPPQKFRQYFGADAVLYITLKSWETVYLILGSSVSVAMDYRLVSTETGEVLWETASQQTISSNSGSGNLLEMVISAALTAATVDYVPLAAQANTAALAKLPPGPYHEGFEEARQQNLEAARQAEAAKKQPRFLRGAPVSERYREPA